MDGASRRRNATRRTGDHEPAHRIVRGRRVRLGLRENLSQFSLLIVVNAFVGAMFGLERSILPALASQEFQLTASSAILSFIMVFGVAKALTNYTAGRVSDRVGRKQVKVAGWLWPFQCHSC